MRRLGLIPKMHLNLKRLPFIKEIRNLKLVRERNKWDGKAALRVGFFTDTYLPNIDGVVNAMVSYRKELEHRGNQVYVFTSGTEADRKEYGDARTFYFESLIFPPYPQYKVALFPFNAVKYAGEARLHLIHSHAIASMGVAAIAAAKALNLPLVGTFHTMLPKATFVLTRSSLGKKLLTEIAWKAIKQFYSPFDLVTAPSRTVEKMLNRNGIAKTAVVPNGIDTAKFSPKYDPKIVRKLLGIPDGEKVVLTAGRLSEEKNVDVLIRAFKRMRKAGGSKAKFIIQGDGPAKPRLQKLVRRLQLQKEIIFTGFVKDYEVPYFYSTADVFATASTFETQGLALLEAMACGKICAGANSLAIPELLKEGKNGFLFRAFDEGDCTEKLLKALDLKDGAKRRIQSNARKTALDYSIERSTGSLMDAYRRVL